MAGSHLGRCLGVLDAALCLLVFFPLSILHWRGTWELQDIYFFPARFLDSNWLSFAIGANLCTLMLLLQPSLATLLQPYSGASYWIITRLHLYIHGWAVMCYWRGLWNLMDIYLTDGWINSAVLLGVCQLISLATSTIRTSVGIPVSIALDTDPDLLAPDTVYKTDPQETWRFIADVLFSQFVIVSSNVGVWRGIWNICDHFLYPHNHLLSDVVSLATGFAVITLMFALQIPCALVSERLEKHRGWKIAYEDVLFTIMCWANLLLWRGGWDLCVEYMLPHTVIGPWICHWLGTIGLTVFQVFNNVGLNGIERDGQYPGGEGLYPTKYLQVYLTEYMQRRDRDQKYHMVLEDEHDADVSDLSDSDYSDSSTKPLYNKELSRETSLNGHLTTPLLSNGDAVAVATETNGCHLSNGEVHMEDGEVHMEDGIS